MKIRVILGVAVALWSILIVGGVSFAAGYIFPHATPSPAVAASLMPSIAVPRFDAETHRYVVDNVGLVMAEKTAAQWRVHDVIQYQELLFVDIQTVENHWWLLVYRWDGEVWTLEEVVLQNATEQEGNTRVQNARELRLET